MSQGPRLPLALARGVADALCRAFEGGCHRIEVVGSIRREVEHVGDIELLAIPRYEHVELSPDAGEQLTMFELGRRRVLVNRLHDAITEAGEDFTRLVPITPGASTPDDGVSWPQDAKWAEKRQGESGYFRLWNPRHEVKIDVFMVAPECWGVAKIIRTGPAEFSKAVVVRWSSLPGAARVSGNRLTRHGLPPVETPTEADVFAALGAAVVEPESRHGFDVLQEAVWVYEQERRQAS